MLTTSTAEAELVEVMEGAVATEALRVMVEEVIGGQIRFWQFTDSFSALTIIIGDTAPWRTRHLRKRARFLRWKAVRGDVLMRHQPGAQMVAEMGTKPQSAVKIKEHKLRLGVSFQEPEEKTKRSPQQKDQSKPTKEGGRLKPALLMAMIARGKVEEDHEETAKGGRELESVMIIYTILVVVVMLMVQRLQRYLTSKIPKKVGKEGLPLKRPSWAAIETTFMSGEFEDHSVEGPECGFTLSGKEEEEKIQIEEGDGLEKRTVEETVRDLAPRSRQGNPSTETLAAASSSNHPKNEVKEIPRRNKISKGEEQVTRSTPSYVAGNGERFHRRRHCTGVKVSKNVREVKLCNECYERDEGRSPGSLTLCAQSIDHLAHTHRNHFDQCHPGKTPRTVKPCQVCRPIRLE